MKRLRHDADCLAWPWVSVEEFGLGACKLNHGRALLRLRERMKEHGCPEITRELLDGHWKNGDRLWATLSQVAQQFLVRGRDAWQLVPDVEMPGREILRWRFLGLALPPGLLTAAAADDGHRPPLAVDVLHGSFAPVGPVAHLHVHIGAASSFELLWTHLMSRRDRMKLAVDAKLPVGWTAARRSVDEWGQWLVIASLARRVLAVLGRERATSIQEAQARVGRDDVDLVHEALAHLFRGQAMQCSRLATAMLFRVATRSSQRWVVPRTMTDVWRNDPIDDGGAWPEGAMLAAVFARLAAEGEPGKALESLFVQYLRIKCFLYRILVHDSTDHGLDSFVHTFRQISSYRAGLERVLPDFAMVERGIELRSLEVRTSPPDTVTEVRTAAKELLRAADGKDLEVAWIFHFIRDAKGRTAGARYRQQFARMRAGAGRLCQAFELRPELLTTIRALDIAGSEREGPLWVAVPVFARLQAHTRVLAARAGVPSLQLTIHVGEDFRHLASGLRAIHEPMQWRLVQRGDRLGHALALGLDPTTWCAANPVVRIPRWERMIDLAWMIGALEGRAVGLDGLHGDGFGLVLARMRRELGKHLACAAEEVGVDDVVALHRDWLGRPDTLPTLLDRLSPRPGPGHPLHLLGLRLFGDVAVQTRLDETCVVETAFERPLLEALSQALVRLVALWQLTIEVNPSSNLLIAGFDAPLEQPIFRLHPLEPGRGLSLPITINADDPLTFSTTLADEYAYAWAAMVLVGGVPPSKAHAWLREAGCASWRAKFTLPRAVAQTRPSRSHYS